MTSEGQGTMGKRKAGDVIFYVPTFLCALSFFVKQRRLLGMRQASSSDWFIVMLASIGDWLELLFCFWFRKAMSPIFSVT